MPELKAPSDQGNRNMTQGWQLRPTARLGRLTRRSGPAHPVFRFVRIAGLGLILLGSCFLFLERQQAVSEAQVEAMRIPAGLDLGHTTHKEVAVAVLAELVAKRSQGRLTATVAPLARVDSAIDPVCGMTVERGPSSHPLQVGDELFYFCCPGCRATFERQQEGI